MFNFLVIAEASISVGGIEIPSNTPFFLMLIAIHVLCALVCVVSGIIAMLANKRPGRHPGAGKVYYYSLVIVFITVIAIAMLRWKEDYHLFVLGAISFLAAFIGRRALKKKWKGWPVYHVLGLGFSYIVLLTAFYVDNGKFLPIWKEFPPIVYWTLPALIGIPIIAYTMLRHPIIKRYFKRL